jgi:hypothetical protein
VTIFWAYYRTPEPERDMDAVIGALRVYEQFATIAMAQEGQTAVRAGRKASALPMSGRAMCCIAISRWTCRGGTCGLQRILRRPVCEPQLRAHVMVDYSELKARDAS